MPEKTILKTAKQEEIDKLNARLMQAEDYDLLTCTQEAADSIANQNSIHKTAAEDRKNVNSDTNGQKKVRFTEPVISDFIQTGKINIIGYRNAKKELDEVKNKKNIKKEEVEAVKGVKTERKREKDKECPIGSSKDVEDCESDDLSEDYRFQDDSSGTDDLDIEPTQDQYEKPNIEIQPEEIKAKLSQEIDVLQEKVQEKVVPETPLIPMNHNPPNTNVIEETPAIFTMPKFNKNFSRPFGKTRKQMKVKTPPLHFKSDAVPETPEIVNIDKHPETHESVGRKKEEFESEDVLEEEISQGNKIPVDAKDVEQISKTNSEVKSKILGESDETVSPDTDFTEVQVANTDKYEKVEHMQVDNDVEDLADKPQGLVDSESSLTQNSESILQTKTVPNKIGSRIDDKNDEAKEAVGRRTNFEGHNKMNMDIEGDCDCPVASIESMTNTKTKKKRKSFMLDEAEESLDFGSLSACEPTSVSEYSESVSKAKRQRVNRLKRSPKTKGNIQDVQKCQSQEKNSGISSSVEIIPDTMTLQSGNKSLTPIKSSNADRIQEKKDSENIDEDTCQVITLSSESGSVASVEEGLKVEGKESNLEKIGTEIEPEPRNLGVTETSDVIAETEIGEIENTAELEIKENVNYSIKCTKNMISEKVKVSDYSKSPKTRKKRKSGQLGLSGQDSQSSIDKVRHLSGLLASPQDSLILSGVKGSPEDIFKMDSEMPSVDLSPNGDIVGEDQNSQSLDLGTLIMEEPHSDYVNSVKRKSIDELDLNDKTDNDLINNDNDQIDREKSDSQGHSSEKLVNPCSKNKETELNINSPSDNFERGGKVSGVRGFAKRKRKSAIGQSPLSPSRSENSAIDETPLSYINSVKYKSPVVKFSSPKLAKARQSEIIDTDILNKVGDDTKVIHNSPSDTSKSKGIKDSMVEVKEINTPVKTFDNINSSKYSPKLLKNKKEKGETNESKFGVEVVELRNDDDDNDECILSPGDLPDIDNDHVKVNKDENVDHIMGHQEHVKITKKSKVSPKLILSSPDKENNVVIRGKKNQDTPKRIEDEEEYNTVIPETMSVDNDDITAAALDVNSPTEGQDKLTGKALDIDEEDCDYNSRTEKETYAKNDFGDVVENSISSSSSSEFRIDSSDEKSIENEALNEISKFNEIVQNSLDINTATDSKVMKNSMITQNKGSNCKDFRKKNSIKIDENESFERSRTLKEGKLKKAQDSLKDISDKNVVDIENMYSTRLDSSPESCIELDMNEESVPVILESDIDDEVDESVKDDVECIDDKQDLDVDREGETEKEMVDEDSDDDSDDDIRIKSGRKRAILSDSSSEEEEEGSRHMNYTSSSAFSSQSENLTTQERQSLEKEVERMAREMEAMKEQLRKSKEMNKAKRPDKKSVKIEDSDDDLPVIEASDSENGDEDLFLSPPAINPGDLEPDGEETLDPAAVQESQNHDEVTDQVEESLSLCQGSFTVPESDPSQVSQSVLQKPNLSNVSHPVIPESDQSKVTRPVLSDLDTNIIPAPKSDPTRHVGIVVTGLNVKQIQQTKKLAALTSAKFFTKFNDSVTHVIVKPADEDDTVCDRTLKFFQGIARKCWIVNFFWVVDSREVGQLLPEGPYEIQGDTTFNQSHFGPKKSRLSKDDKLFQKFQFSLIGDNTYLSKDSMCDLIETCGGEVMDIVKLSKGKRTQFVISCTDIDDDEEDVQSIVKHAREMYKKHGIVTLTREWILDSLTLYKIQPVQDYLVTDLPNLKLPLM
ncbi:breast cancer type 1 susceptibility protein-like [Ruditapes philippinarum]|uniref:breast cancer type 1 susceptibility protein-like n=1 Tax=Ruditapes philippinarum TaxID=129788 RepID=UPI00295A5B59|nr:breast cancer type 1 susceptibility protein-like [Ruditapes philippinarum]